MPKVARSKKHMDRFVYGGRFIEMGWVDQMKPGFQ